MDAIETIEQSGFTMRLHLDDNPESPREWDNLGTMVCWHRKYRLGDTYDKRGKLPYDPARYSPDEYMRALAADLVSASDADAIPDEHIERILDKHTERLPLYLYDHSGLAMSTSGFSCPWDSGQVGFIYVTRAQIIAEYGDDTPASRERARKCMIGEVETYDQFLRGDVYGYTIEDAAGDIVDSCWGFYGDEYALQEATSALESCIEHTQARNEESITVQE